MCFRNYGIRKRLLNKCPKQSVSEEPSTSNMVNMVNAPKSCVNHDDGIFTIFIDDCEHDSVEKSLF